jgi:3-oxoacyl-[acyl-carrier-protein] synthase-3
MNLWKSAIIGTGSYAPEKVLTNHDLEWIRRRTGMVERRIADKDTASSDLGIQSSLRAIESAGIDPIEIELIIVPTVTPDMFFPSTACFIQKGIKASKAAAFDISAGCSGFPYALVIADQFIKCGTYKTILVVAAETLSKITDWTDRSTCERQYSKELKKIRGLFHTILRLMVSILTMSCLASPEVDRGILHHTKQ